MRHQVKVAGDASSLTITTMHDIGNTFDPLFVSPDIFGVSGLSFAVVDDEVTPQAAMASRALSVAPGTTYLALQYISSCYYFRQLFCLY